MAEEPTRGNYDVDIDRSAADPDAPSGWVTTKQAARSLGVSPRTVRWHIDKRNLEAIPEGEGVKRTWFVSIDSLQSFRSARQSAGGLPRGNRTASEYSDIAPDIPGNPIRELADRLAEEAARAAEYRARLELTEQAQTSLEEELATERVRREQAELERDELRSLLEASLASGESSAAASEEFHGTHAPPTPDHPVERPESEEGPLYGTSAEEAEASLQRRSSTSWWRRFFGFE